MFPSLNWNLKKKRTQFGKYLVSGIPPQEEGASKPKVTLSFRLNNNGLVVLEKAEAEITVIEPAKEETTTTSTEDKEKEESATQQDDSTKESEESTKEEESKESSKEETTEEESKESPKEKVSFFFKKKFLFNFLEKEN